MFKREFLSTFAGNAVNSVIGFATWVILLNTLQREGQALLYLACFIPSILATFCGLGQETVNATFAGLHKDRRQALFVQSILTTLFSAGMSAAVIGFYFFLLPDAWRTVINPAASNEDVLGQFVNLSPTVIWLSALLAPASVLSANLSALVRGVGRITTSAALQVVPQAATLILAVVLLWVLHMGLTAAITLTVLATIIGALIPLWYLREYITLRPSVLSRDLARKSLVFGIQICLANLGALLVYRINQAILSYEEGCVTLAQIGSFVAAVGLAERLRIVPGSLGQAFLPRLANELAAHQGQVPAVFRYSLVISSVAMLGMAGAGIGIILTVLKPEWRESIVPFLIMLPGVVLLGGASILSSDFLTRGKPYYALVFAWANLVVNIALNLLLIPWMGILGAVLTSTVSYSLACVASMFIYRHEAKVPLSVLVPRWADCMYIWHSGWELVHDMWAWVCRRGAPKILTIGEAYWAEVAAGMLRRAGFEAAFWEARPEDLPRALRPWRPLRAAGYYLRQPFRGASVIHAVCPTGCLTTLRVARLMRKRVLCHWIGTDVMLVGNAARSGNPKLLTLYRKLAGAHFADSPELVKELLSLGIRAEVFRLLPETILPASEVPMPEAPAVLCYWSPARRAFYHGEIADALAEEFADVKFLVVGTDGAGEPQHANMKYLGRVLDLEPIYRQVSVYLRVPEHDSVSAMVLEALARGRWVIYNKSFPHAEMASSLEEAREALRRCLDQPGSNAAGRAYVGREFSPAAESERVAPLYRSLLGQS